MLLAAIVACEIGFWVLIATGLLVRYVLRWPRTSVVLLAATPVVDLVLLVLTVLDLRRGSPPAFAHGVAAVYLGFSVVFGHSMVRWADQRVAHRFAGGPPPAGPAQYGAARVRHEWRTWGKAVLASGIAAALLLGAIAFVSASGGATGELWEWIGRLGTVLAVWLVGWPLWTTVRPPQPRPERART